MGGPSPAGTLANGHPFSAERAIAEGRRWPTELQSIVSGPNPADTLANEHPFSSEQPIFVRPFLQQNVVHIDHSSSRCRRHCLRI